jgi:PPP family 3-phenylpropionic acid transporter
LIAYLADHIGNHRKVLVLLCWGALVTLAAFVPLSGFWALLLAATAFGIFWTSIMPLTEAIAMTEVKLQGLDYGRMRLWGSLTFIIASLGGGVLIDQIGEGVILPAMLGAALITTLSVYMLPKGDSRGNISKATPLPPIHWREALQLTHSPLFLLFLFTASTIQASHAIYYGFGTLHWRSLGLSAGLIGALWAIGVIAEVTLFAFSKPIIEKLGPTRLLIIAAIGAIVRWSITSLDPPLLILAPIQALHALTYGAAHLGAIHFIAHAVPEQYSATGQGLYSAFAMGAVMGLATALAGFLYGSLGGWAFAVMAIIATSSLLAALLLHRKWSGQMVFGEQSAS